LAILLRLAQAETEASWLGLVSHGSGLVFGTKGQFLPQINLATSFATVPNLAVATAVSTSPGIGCTFVAFGSLKVGHCRALIAQTYPTGLS